MGSPLLRPHQLDLNKEDHLPGDHLQKCLVDLLLEDHPLVAHRKLKSSVAQSTQKNTTTHYGGWILRKSHSKLATTSGTSSTFISANFFNSTEEIDGRTIDYYELNIEAFQEQIYNGLEPANLVGFNGTSPGPTFRVQRGHETVVRINNNHDEASNLHLHGSPNHAVWDGWAHDLIQPGQYKDYYFPNYESARPIWYHGHRDQLTADDAYLGQAGAYIIEFVLAFFSYAYAVVLTNSLQGLGRGQARLAKG